MNLGCSSAAAGLHVASGLVRSGAQKRVLVVTPEIIEAVYGVPVTVERYNGYRFVVPLEPESA